MNQGYAGSNNAVATAPREPNLNERLNRLSENLQVSCERIEAVLSRVNGTPRGGNVDAAAKLSQISPTLPLATVVEHLEAVRNRLNDLASNAERIA